VGVWYARGHGAIEIRPAQVKIVIVEIRHEDPTLCAVIRNARDHGGDVTDPRFLNRNRFLAAVHQGAKDEAHKLRRVVQDVYPFVLSSEQQQLKATDRSDPRLRLSDYDPIVHHRIALQQLDGVRFHTAATQRAHEARVEI
jgi:hypothetical protein